MRVFDHPNMDNFVCPICKKSDDVPVVLIGIVGTEEEGNMQAKQVHVDCLELSIDEQFRCICQLY
jgi:hypothetical protein